jgi:anti-sigma factor RsiW
MAEKFSNYDLQAFIDGELDGGGERRMKKLIAENPEIKERYQELIRQRHLLKCWWSTKPFN